MAYALIYSAGLFVLGMFVRAVWREYQTYRQIRRRLRALRKYRGGF